ncbi:ATP-binding protein [Microbacterium sp. C5A9]|uniref:ATP-binding protein n=1 Tax=Microbacterium sp. C5A9 TaxID=2736663 RepID=UPI001F519A01|nr:ATP-binding protein [Microbacterium sp. C5A9]MCI1018878.1 ATP-binding protein [Microbacterium sp. C5A9]
MGSEPGSARVIGAATPAFVDEVLDALDALWAESAHVASEDRTLFTLAVSEVATNIVQHAEAFAHAEISVDVALRVAPDELLATIVDTAHPASIDWENVSMPDHESESGRGLAIATAALDEFEHSGGSAGNTWVLRRRLS